MHDDRRAEILATVERVVNAGPYAPTWESLTQYTPPAWYVDGKFGIFIHWGVYSVPAFGNEWYPREMYRQGEDIFKHHVETYGPQDQFGYKEFIPKFTAEKFDAEAWAALFDDAGARFVVPVAEHHDGFSLAETDLSRWNAVNMGPKRDVIGLLASAVRKHGGVFGASTHRAEHFWFFDGGREFPSDVQDPEFDDFYGPAQPGPVNSHVVTDRPPDEPFLKDWLARTCELIDRYRPQLIWFDWWIHNVAFEPYLRTLAAFYYNRGAEWGQGVAINYKYEAFPVGAAVFDVERGQLAGIRPQFWQTDTSVSKSSWGYTENQDYKTATSLIGDLVDIVSKNGALLLNVGPRADGTIPEPEQEILREIGAWLKVNGEAIYGTRPWTQFGEGPTEIEEGAFTDTKRAGFTGQDFRFTRGKDALYAIAMAYPGEKAVIKSLSSAAGRVDRVTLLGAEGDLSFEQTEEGLVVTLPATTPEEYPRSLKIEGIS